MRLKAIAVLSSLFLSVLLSGCAKPQPVREVLEVHPVPIPPSLLIDCYVPELPQHPTFGDSVELNNRLYLSIENCNGQIGKIRQIEESRASH